MPKFCQRCGNLVDDSAAVCGACGSPVTDAYPEEPVTADAQQQYPQPQYQQQYAQPQYRQQYAQPQYIHPHYPQQTPSVPEPKKKSKKGLFIGVGIGAAVLVAAVVAFFIWILPMLQEGANTPQECIDKMIEELAEGDVDGMLDYIYETKFSSTYKEAAKQQMTSQSGFNDSVTMMKAMGKDGFKQMFEIKVDNEKEVTSSEKESIMQTLKQAGVPTDNIEKIVSADMHMVNKLENETEDSECYFVKAKGKYYILASAMAMFNNSSGSSSSIF